MITITFKYKNVDSWLNFGSIVTAANIIKALLDDPDVTTIIINRK